MALAAPASLLDPDFDADEFLFASVEQAGRMHRAILDEENGYRDFV